MSASFDASALFKCNLKICKLCEFRSWNYLKIHLKLSSKTKSGQRWPPLIFTYPKKKLAHMSRTAPICAFYSGKTVKISENCRNEIKYLSPSCTWSFFHHFSFFQKMKKIKNCSFWTYELIFFWCHGFQRKTEPGNWSARSAPQGGRFEDIQR